jgi:CRISPR-associated protein Csx10
MNRYRLLATLLSPVVVKRDRQSQRSEGTSSLSGSVLRGALAAQYLQSHGAPDEPFRRLFLDESACRFGPLDPGPRTLPATAVSCKRHPGFLADAKPDRPEDRPHGMADHLWSRIASRLAGDQDLRGGETLPKHCRVCSNDLKPQDGFWLEGEKGPRKPGEVGRRLNTHVGIDRATHTAAEAILYSLDALDPVGEETALVGWLDADEAALADWKRLVEECDGEIRVGHARTRGYGRVRLALEQVQEQPADELDRWSDDLHRFVQRAWADSRLDQKPELDPGRHFFFALSLPAGAILVDPLLRASLDPADTTEWLPPVAPPKREGAALDPPGKPLPEGGSLRCVAAVAHQERIRGWNAAHGLPRQDEWAVNRGSVYAYLFEGDAAARESLLGRLGELERDGIGARRNEGFGRVVVSDDFHRRFRTQEQAGGKS